MHGLGGAVHAVFKGDIFLLASPRFRPCAPRFWSHLFPSVASHCPHQYITFSLVLTAFWCQRSFSSAVFVVRQCTLCKVILLGSFNVPKLSPKPPILALKVWSNAVSSVYSSCILCFIAQVLYSINHNLDACKIPSMQMSYIWQNRTGNLIRAGFYVLSLTSLPKKLSSKHFIVTLLGFFWFSILAFPRKRKKKKDKYAENDKC